MPILRPFNFSIGLGLMLVFSFACNTQAQVSSWTGNNDTDFGDADNWTQGVPNENSIAAIGPHQNAINGAVFLDQARHLGGLLITDGMIVGTADHELTVNNLNGGGLTIAGGNIINDNNFRASELYVHGGNDGIFDLIVNGNLRVLDGAGLQLRDRGWVRVNDGGLTIDSDSFLEGDGVVVLGNNSLYNNGRITAKDGDAISFLGNDDSNIDFDGDQETGFLQAINGGRLFLGSESSERFDGNAEIGSSSSIDFQTFGQSFGTANIEFSADALENAGTLSLIHNVQFESELLTLHATGHGKIKGAADENDIPTAINGQARIRVEEGGSLTFGEGDSALVTDLIGGNWQVEQDGVLDFKDALGSAQGVQVQLNGGMIKGSQSSQSGTFNNSDPLGIRGFGHFKLPLSNSTVIAADGGELVIEGQSPGAIDWDGDFDTGQLRAEAGDLRLIDIGTATTNGNVRIGGGNQLTVDGFRMEFAGNVLLNGGTLASEKNQRFTGTVDVTRQSTMDAFASFEDGVQVDLQADLSLVGHSALIANTAQFSGLGDLINESDNRLSVAGGSFVGVDVINNGVLDNDNIENPGIVSFGGRLDNYGTILFGLGGAELDDLTHFDIKNDLLADDGIFQVALVNDFNPTLGDEFDLLDFGSFIDNGFELDLPSLNQGLAWDSSDFTSQGILRISTAVPEPSGIVLFAIGGLGLLVRRRRV